MLKVIITIAVLLAIVLIKKIPYIGGNITSVLAVAGILTFILNGNLNVGNWILAWIDGLDRMAWIMCLAAAGSIFAEINTTLGAVDTVIGALKAKFYKSPRALAVSVLFVLCLAGSLMGDAVAASTVIGMLTFGIFASMNLPLHKICCLVVMGASIGSIMPPMTQAIALAATLANTDPDAVMNMGFISVGFVFVAMAIYTCLFLVKKDNVPGANPDIIIHDDGKTAGQILKENWKSLLPVGFLILVIICRSVSAIGIDLGPLVLKAIKLPVTNGVDADGNPVAVTLYSFLSGTTILKGLTNGVVISIVCAIIFSLLFQPVRENFGKIFKTGVKNSMPCVGIQIACSLMIGAFYACGTIDQISDFCLNLGDSVLKIGAGVCLMILGALTGSQSTAQNIINSFALPIMIEAGGDPTFIALGGAHLGAGGMGLPPADLTTFVIAGLIQAQFKKECDPLKSMFWMLPYSFIMCAVGFFCWFVLA